MAQQVPTRVLRAESPKVRPNAEVGDGCILDGPLRYIEAAQQYEATTLQQVAQDCGKPRGKRGQPEGLRCDFTHGAPGAAMCCNGGVYLSQLDRGKGDDPVRPGRHVCTDPGGSTADRPCCK